VRAVYDPASEVTMLDLLLDITPEEYDAVNAELSDARPMTLQDLSREEAEWAWGDPLDDVCAMLDSLDSSGASF